MYPALWSRTFPSEDRNPHQHDAYSVARWMQQSDATDTLAGYFQPQLSPADRRLDPWPRLGSDAPAADPMLKTKSVHSAIEPRKDGLRILATRVRGRGLLSSRPEV